MNLTAGTVVDRKYEILGPLAEGGMGSVYRARHVLTEQEVALKVLTVGPTDMGQARRFKLEVSVAAKVKHPAIVKVHDAGIELETGRFYIAMELLRGRSLREAIEDGESADKTIRWLLEAIAAIAAAHAMGVIHRDLKPDNLFVEETEEGQRLRVLDFGIARDLSGPSATTTGVAVGTALYMSPEQATASKELGPAVDVWAFGAILYEILTGRHPFEGASAHAVVVNAVTCAHVSVAALRPDIDEGWADLIDGCLAKAPERRPATTELLAAMSTLLEAEEMLATHVHWGRDGATPGDAPTEPWTSTPDHAEHALAATMAAPSIVESAAHAVEATPSAPRAALTTESVPPVPTRSATPMWATLGLLVLAGVGVMAWQLSDSEVAPTDEPTLEPTSTAEERASVELPAPSTAEEPDEPEAAVSQTEAPAPVTLRRPARPRPAAPPSEPAPAEVAAIVGAPEAVPIPDPEPRSEPESTPVAQPALPPREAPDEGRGVLQGESAFDRQVQGRRH